MAAPIEASTFPARGKVTERRGDDRVVFAPSNTNYELDLLAEARRLSQIEEKTALVHAGLRALIARESARRLAALGGTEPAAAPTPRRRSRPRKSR